MEQALVGVGGEDGAVVRDYPVGLPVLGQRGREQLKHRDGVLVLGGHARQDLARVALDDAQRVHPVVIVA